MPPALTPPATQPAEAPPVIVDETQLQAIARLQALVASGRLNETALPPPRPDDAAELTISPIRIPEITVPDVDAPVRAPEIAPR
jgi:hypothetical protein